MSDTPFLGLEPFSEKDSPFFFGRDEQKRVIARSLRVSRLTVLFGESGVGKSSILQAGVVPLLRRDAEQNQQEYGKPRLAIVVFRDWHGENPLQRILEQIRAAVAEAMNIEPICLQDRPTPVETLQDWTKILGGDQGIGQLFLILDQFEEYFQYHPQESGDRTFANEFPRWVNCSDLRVNFLIGIRHDALHKLHCFRESILNILDNRLELTHLDRSAAKEAIVKPIGEYNLRQIIASYLQTSRLSVLSGAKGLGKSRVLQAISDNLKGVIIFKSWRGDPVADLVQQVKAGFKSLFPHISVPESSTSLTETLKECAECIAKDAGNNQLFIILDQFEEFFQYQPPDMSEGSFVAEFSRAINDPNLLPVHFLISIRDEARDILKHFQERIPNIFDHLLQIKQLGKKTSIEDLIIPIKEPAQQPSKAISIDPELVEEVLDQLSPLSLRNLTETAPDKIAHPSTSPKRVEIEAPLLQLVMRHIWEEEMKCGSHCLCLETLKNQGGVKKIVEKHLNQAMESLSKEQQDIMSEIFGYLVTPSRTKYAYSVSDLAANTKWDVSQVTALLEILADTDHRIVRPVPPEEGRYEILHDVLAQPILEWRRRYLEKQRIEKETAELKEKQRQETESLLKEAEKQRLEAEKQRVQALQQRANAEKRLGSALLATGIVALASLGILGYQYQVARLNLKGNQALAQWEFSDQLTTLQAAMQAGQTVKTWNLLQQAPIPALALQQILDRIHEQNQWQAFDRLASGFGRSPDGQWLAVGSIDGQVSLWNFQQQRWTKPFSTHGGQIYSVDLSQDAERIVTTSADNQVRVWSRDGQRIQSFLPFLPQGTNQGSLSRLPISLSPDGRTLAIVTETSTIQLWDINTGKRISSHDVSKDNEALNRVFRIRFSPDGKQLAIASEGNIGLWNLQDNHAISWTAHEEGVIFDLRFSPDGKRLAAVSSDATASLWDLKGQRLWVVKGHKSAVFSVAFNSDGTQLATGASDGTARVWDLTDRPQFREVEVTERLNLNGNNSNIMAVSFSQDNQRLATVTRLATASLWNLSEKQPTFNLPLEQQNTVVAFSQVIFSRDRQQLATASFDGDARLWDLQGNLIRLFPGEAGLMDRTPRIFFASNGQQLATILGDGTARLWNLNDESKPKILFTGRRDQWVVDLDLEPEHSRLVTTTEKGIVRIWDFQGHRLQELQGHQDRVTDADFSPDARWLATTSWDNTVRLWDLQRDQSRELKGHQGRITMVRFSPDGQRLATASQDGTARLWNLQGNPIQTFSHSQGSPVMSVRFSEDGKWLATASWNGTARVWDLRGNQLAEYRSDAGLWDASFSPDGTQLAAVGWRGAGQVWPVQTLDQLLQKGCVWMKDYLNTHPEAKSALKFCPT